MNVCCVLLQVQINLMCNSIVCLEVFQVEDDTRFRKVETIYYWIFLNKFLDIPQIVKCISTSKLIVRCNRSIIHIRQKHFNSAKLMDKHSLSIRTYFRTRCTIKIPTNTLNVIAIIILICEVHCTYLMLSA